MRESLLLQCKLQQLKLPTGESVLSLSLGTFCSEIHEYAPTLVTLLRRIG